ncbi:hypothetical protein ACFWIB_41710, partial [Streptomyces sp. NPDC127051]
CISCASVPRAFSVDQTNHFSWSGVRKLRGTSDPLVLWSSLKKRELANLDGDHLADAADATEQGHRINHNQQLPWSFLAHTGLAIHPPHPQNQRKDQ